MGRKISEIAVMDTAAVEQRINEIRGTATSWTFNVADIARIAEKAEKRLEKMHIAPTHRRGAIAIARSAGPGANAYKYAVNGSEIALHRAKDGWRLVSYNRCNVYPRSPEKIDLRISREQHGKSIETMLRDFRTTIIEKDAA